MAERKLNWRLLFSFRPRLPKLCSSQNSGSSAGGNSTTSGTNSLLSWRRKFLIIAGITEAIVLVPVAVLSIILAVSGFAAGEMGNMVGILSSMVLFFLLPLCAGRVTAVYGLFKQKPWAATLTIIIYGLCLPGAFPLAGVSPVLFALYVIYNGFGIWSAVICRRGSLS